MRNKRLLITAVICIAVIFVIVRFLPRPYIAGGDYKNLYVTRVIDGDTIELSNGEKVRYIGIDTPELRERNGSGWVYNPRPYAEAARDFNRKLVEGKPVRLEFDVQKRDKYERLLAYVFIGDKMVNLDMVRQGYAMIYTFPPNVKYVDEFVKAQKDARGNHRGLWEGLGKEIILASEAGKNTGLVRMVDAYVLDTYVSGQVLILNCKDNFKVVMFKDYLPYLPKQALRSPEAYFKHKTVRVYGMIKRYKDVAEIVLHDASQSLQVLE